MNINTGAQYVARLHNETTQRLIEHKTSYDRRIHRHMMGKHYFKLVIQILCQAPDNEPNPELWLTEQQLRILLDMQTRQYLLQ